MLRDSSVAIGNHGHPFDFGGNSAGAYTWSDAAIYEDFGTTDRLGWNPATQVIAADGKAGVTTVTGLSVNVGLYHIYSPHSAIGDWGARFDGFTAASTTTNAVNFTLAAGNEYVGARKRPAPSTDGCRRSSSTIGRSPRPSGNASIPISGSSTASRSSRRMPVHRITSAPPERRPGTASPTARTTTTLPVSGVTTSRRCIRSSRRASIRAVSWPSASGRLPRPTRPTRIRLLRTTASSSGDATPARYRCRWT